MAFVRSVKYILLVISLFSFATVWSQNTTPTKGSQIIVEKAETFYYKKIGELEFQWMVGKVRMRQDNVYMSCDSALLLENRIKAYSKVLIQQTDTLSIFADSLWYDGDTHIADLWGNVIMVNGNQKLFTNQLKYNLSTKVAQYNNGAILYDGKTKLKSTTGYYYVNDKTIYFKDKVNITDPDFSLKADTLKFTTDTRIATFLGPTLISQDTTNIYCEAGYYDIQNHKAEFRKHAQYEGKDTKAAADTIFYNGIEKSVSLIGKAHYKKGKEIAVADKIIHYDDTKVTSLFGHADYQNDKQSLQGDEIHYDGTDGSFHTVGRSRVSDPPQILEADHINYSKGKGYGKASGEVVWQDTSARIIVKCDTTYFDKAKDYLKAYGRRPLLISYEGKDSTFLTADTLKAFKQIKDLDSSRIFLAYHDVRILRKDMQGISDSLSYNTKDSMLTFYKVPILWSDTTQFLADTIKVFMSHGQIKKVYMRQNTLIINSPDQKFFNQIKGRDVNAWFIDRKLNNMFVEGNAEAVYYALDNNKAYIGVNKCISSTMTLLFKENKVNDIYFVTNPQSKFIPMTKANHDKLKLPGFKWDYAKRPKVLADLF